MPQAVCHLLERFYLLHEFEMTFLFVDVSLRAVFLAGILDEVQLAVTFPPSRTGTRRVCPPVHEGCYTLSGRDEA